MTSASTSLSLREIYRVIGVVTFLYLIFGSALFVTRGLWQFLAAVVAVFLGTSGVAIALGAGAILSRMGNALVDCDSGVSRSVPHSVSSQTIESNRGG
jgi:hypothetical protein